MKKHRPRTRKARHRNNSPQKAIAAAPDNGIEPVYYHGGAPHLKPGDYILPRAETGKYGFNGSQYGEGWAADWLEMKDDLEDANWVFVTTNRMLASYYAIGNKSGAGMLYAVQPEGTVERDPDRPIDCWRAERARIIAVERVPYQFRQQVRSLGANVAHLSMFEIYTRLLPMWTKHVGS